MAALTWETINIHEGTAQVFQVAASKNMLTTLQELLQRNGSKFKARERMC